MVYNTMNIFSYYKKNIRFIRGFTLVELLVASSIFTSVLIIAVGALFSAQAINTKLQETQVILDGVNLATEVISREIRYGSEFHCDNATPTPITIGRLSCAYPNGGTVLVFQPASKLAGSLDSTLDRVSYSLGEVRYNNATSGVVFREEYPGGTAIVRTYQVTPTDVDVQNLIFYATGANSSSGALDVGGTTDEDQPSITLTVSGVTVPSKQNVEPVTFNLQTSISARGLDN